MVKSTRGILWRLGLHIRFAIQSANKSIVGVIAACLIAAGRLDAATVIDRIFEGGNPARFAKAGLQTRPDWC
ncbi:hypothetical protein N9K35_05775 [Pseudomonadales bacterium]|nr:hypothetical protein [Pseudomonadales bacterium]